MCQTTMTTMLGDGDPHVDRHVLRNTQRKLKMEAVLGSTSAGSDRMKTPSPQRKSILSRSQSYSGKENMPRTPPPAPGTTTISRLAASAAGAGAGPSSSPSPTKTTPLLGSGSDTKQENLRYTSLSELVITIPNSPFGRSESFGTSSPAAAPRTPMKDALVEKAVRAYLQPSESFNTRGRSSGWGMCMVLHRFLPSFMTKFSVAIPNPVQFFFCAIHAVTMYATKQTKPPPLFLLRGSDRSRSSGSTQSGMGTNGRTTSGSSANALLE